MNLNINIIVKDSAIHQKGLFTENFIPIGTRIIKYTGELITNEEADRREEENDKTGITYIFILNEKYCIDGAIGGNDFRFANHSCQPSCNIEIEENNIYLVANRNIDSGEELTFDYAFDKNDTRVVCHCGSPNCRGFLNEV